MKVGLSFSRCLRDIFEGTVKFDDVLVIVSRTDVDPHNDNHWNSLSDVHNISLDVFICKF